MIGEIHFDFSSLQNIIILVIIILASIYFYYELKKIKNNIIYIENEFNNIYEKFQNDTIKPQHVMGEHNIDDNYENENENENDIVMSDVKYENENDNNNNNNDDDDKWSEINQFMQKENDDDKGQNIDNIENNNLPPEENNIDNILDSLNNIGDANTNDLEIENNEEICETNGESGESGEFGESGESGEIKNIIPNYESMTVSQLKSILTDLNLPVSGNKTKLIKRINENKSLEL